MTDTTLLDAIRVAHFLGIALGMGLALFADFVALQFAWRSIDSRSLQLLQRLHGLIFLGLALLWASGVAIIYIKTGFDLTLLSAKVWSKLAIVTILTVNALIMGRIALPLLSRGYGHRLGDLGGGTRATLGIIGGLSAACWISALMLGGFTELKQATAPDLVWLVGSFVGAGTLFGLAVAFFVAPRLPFDLQPSNPWLPRPSVE